MFSTPLGILNIDETTPRPHGNKVIYGILFQLDNSEHYIKVLDGIMSAYLGDKENDYDVRQRRKVKVTPIKFSSIDDLQRLKYNELPEMEVEGWFGSMKNERVRNYVYDYSNQYRIQSGVSQFMYKQLKTNFERKVQTK